MIRSGLELESHLQGKPLLALGTLKTSNGAVLTWNQQKRLSPPGAFGHPVARLFSFLLIGSTQSYVEDDLEDWLSTPPSAELRHQLHEYDGKIVAMLLSPPGDPGGMGVHPEEACKWEGNALLVQLRGGRPGRLPSRQT